MKKYEKMANATFVLGWIMLVACGLWLAFIPIANAFGNATVATVYNAIGIIECIGLTANLLLWLHYEHKWLELK